MARVTPYDKVEDWLTCYTRWKAKIEALKIHQQDISGRTRTLELVAIHGKGQHSDPTLREVVKRSELDAELSLLEKRVQLIEISFSALTPEERDFVHIRYMEQMAISLTMDRLNIVSIRTYYRIRGKLLEKVFDAMGGIACVPLFEEK